MTICEKHIEFKNERCADCKAEWAEQTRDQNLRDAATLLEVIKSNPSPNLSVIWADLNAAEVANEVDNLAHIVEWLNLS
jgi:hypothetical protein